MDLPVVDLSSWTATEGDATDRAGVVATVRAACEDVGFFQVVGHGIDPGLWSSLERSAREFFALPEDEKALIAMERGGRAWRGWFPVGGELTSGIPDDKEGLYFGTDLPVDHPAVLAGTPLHGTNLHPARPEELGDLVEQWIREVTEVGQVLLQVMALALGLEQHWFRRWCADPVVLFRIFHYPPKPLDLPAQWGVAEHTDYGLLTLLAQDDTGGLEVFTHDRWIEVEPLADAFVCNLGDMLERVTGGLFRSTRHRVRLPATDRISMPLFLDPGWDAVVTPLPGREPDPGLERVVAARRWDDVSVFDGEARYGDYLLAKVSRVFPELFALVMAEPPG